MTENEKLQKAIEEEKELYEIMKDRYEKLGVESCKDRAEEHELNIKWLEEIQQYKAIGTIEEFKDLKEKSVAKKIVSRGQGHEADCYCPNCNAFLGNDQDWCFNQTNHCSECGQALET